MVTVTFTKQLERFLETPSRAVEATTVRQALDRALAPHPRLRPYVLDEQGRLRKHVTIFVADRMLRDRAGLTDPVADGETVHVLQALSGG